ncbi:polyketide synthase [Nemania sp. FL0031]|nr:polyketide synthase [Nemania sp. FL0031]
MSVDSFVTASSDSSVVVLNCGEDNNTEGTGSMDSLESDPPCIVGMACRLPGDIYTPSDLWNFIIDQRSAQSAVPPGRYNIDGFYHPEGGSRSGSTNVPGGYFINQDIRQFDNSFFGINNLEATYMDPQQRKLLEVVFECLQSSGTTMDGISGSTTGVYVANFTVDYQPGQTRDPDYIHRYTATGSGATVMSNRISHVFNLLGPSFTIDTACSSSVFALHQALNALKTGDCDSAIVASANLIMSPELHIGAAKSGVLSPTGTCHTFDSSADGYGRAEAVNAIYVKRLSAALRDGNPIRAVIRGSAVNASGRTPGISLPSGKMQEVVMRKAYREAGLDFSGTDYVECHGTGTPVGDPIEVDAVGRCFSPREGPPLLIGSVKTNVGHSEGASGLTSILKVVQAFEKGQIPPSYGVVKLNPKLILEERNMKIATKVEQWPRSLRRASINSFGYGGANGHIILESVDSYLGRDSVPSPRTNGTTNGIVANGVHTNGIHANGVHNNGANINGSHPNETTESDRSGQRRLVLPITAASKSSLEKVADQISQEVSHLESIEGLKSLAHTLSKGRDHFRHRNAIVASYDNSLGKCTTLVDDTAPKESTNPLLFVFVFTGQGAQYAGMAKELLNQSRQFRDTIRNLDAVLQALPAPYAPSWTLEQTILDNPEVSRINEVSRSQPICTAVQVGLVDLLRAYGVQPTSVVGHSSGEIAAAYAAGLLTAPQAIQVAYFRGYAVGELRSEGLMMAAGIGTEQARSLIEENALQAEVRVACVNSPDSVTLSGSLSAIGALQSKLQSDNKFVRKLDTGGRAYHSHMMEEIGPLYEELLAAAFHGTHGKKQPLSASDSCVLSPSGVKMYSSVGHAPSDLRIVDSQTMGPAYWRHNLERPVQFSAALATLAADQKQVHLIEIGPHSALKGPIQQIRKAIGLNEKSLPYSPTLVRKEDANLRLKMLASTLFTRGHALDWDSVNDLDSAVGQPKPQILHQLAPYPWDYSTGLLWSEPRPSVEMRNRKHLRHELLGTGALAGNGIDYTFRNILQPNEMPWLKDHKLEEQVVFPAAGYVAMAVEAVSQVTGIKKQLKEGGRDISFELRNVNISAALNIPEENDSAGKDLEVHTTISPRRISGANVSIDWHDFSISSLFWTSEQATVHCTGSIRVVRDRKEVDSTYTTVNNAEGFDLWSSTSRWYSKWHQEGLCFGPMFQSLTSLRTDSARKRHEAIATAQILPSLSGGTYEYYPVHPITIDAALQAACLSGTAGHVAALKTWLPVFIAECRIQPSTYDGEGEIHVKSEVMGFTSQRIDASIRDGTGALVLDFKDSRIALYNGKNGITIAQQAPETKTPNSESASIGSINPLELYLQRQPTLRVNWKPDVLRIGKEAAAQLREYVASFVEQQQPDIRDDESLAVIGALLELAGHKNPHMRVLELGGDAQGYKARQWLSMLGKETAFSRVRSWHACQLGEKGEFLIQGEVEGPFDVVLIPKHSVSASKGIWTGDETHITSLVSENGVVITRKSDTAIDGLQKAGFDVLDVKNQVLLAVKPSQKASLRGRKALIVQADQPSKLVGDFSTTLAAYLRKAAGISDVKIIGLEQIETAKLKAEDICISSIELEREFLPTISPQAMDRLRIITDTVTDLLWLTGGNMLGKDPNPDLTLSNGLSRALMLEQPTTRWSVLDVGHAQTQLRDPSSIESVAGHIIRALVARYEKDDCEFILSNGLTHISRFSPDSGLNSLLRRRLDPVTTKIEKQTLAEANPARLTIGQPGVTDSMHFQQLCEPGDDAPPATGYVDIEVKAVSLNAKDVYAMNGRVETRNKTTAFDFSGIVTAVAADSDSDLKVGDRVVAYAPFHIATTARVPVGCVHRLLDHEEFTVMPTLMVVYATALYALNDRAHLRRGESVLVHAGSGGFGIAAITLAQNMGAVVYTTCGSQAKRDYLINELGVAPENIYSSRDASFVQHLRDATGGRGVDVVINSLVGDLMHDSWEHCLADFGRFVEIGKRELIDAGRLDMRVFLRNATFTAFDLSELFYAKDPFNRAIWDRLLVETLQFYRAGKIRELPMKVFDITQVSQAYRFFGNKNRVGKVVISMEDPQARVPVVPAPFLSRFPADKVYLLVGCLGGLGRSLSRWMMSRGARHFVFLGRSGADKPSAQELVTRLERAGATVGVVRGDVVNPADIKAAVAACVSTGKEIGGVVQAAMGLHEALWTRMPNEAWHTGIDPKWKGTWNLHNALEGHKLDFFLLTSSVSGTVGTATESNYCSANGFLDAFAHWRRSQGQPCISVGLGMISEVGYLHENPEIEALLLRKGIQPLNEDEFLQVIDLALASESDGSDTRAAHILTGLEPAAVRELAARGFDVTSHGVLVEARASLLLASLQAEKEAADAASSHSQSANSSAASKAAAPWFKDVPAGLAASFAPEANADTMKDAIVSLMKKRFSNLILLPLDQVDEHKPLPGFGVDSMIASEFRSWFWAVFRVNVPFLDIMSPQKSLAIIAGFVESKVIEGPAK